MFPFLSKDLKEEERYLDARYICINSNYNTTFKGVARASVSDYSRCMVGSDMRWAASKFFTPSLGPFADVLLIARYIQRPKHTFTLYRPDTSAKCADLRSPSSNDDMHLQFSELAKKHGSMFSVRLADTQFVVVLSDSLAS